MARGPADLVIQYIRKFAGAPSDSKPSDGQLVDRFVNKRSEQAFEWLIERHGPMVLRLCYRILGTWHDAEDVFQAVFLLLARKAGSIRKRASVGSWLHGVAYRLAVEAKRKMSRQLPMTEKVETLADHHGDYVTWRELRIALDEELTRLPEKYRAPLLLCYLESLTRDEAARRLGCPLGTCVIFPTARPW